MSTAPVPPPRPRGRPAAWLAAAVVAGLGFVAIWQGHAPFYGSDVHVTRVIGVVVPLFLGGLFVARRRGAARVLGSLIAVALAVAAWWLVPSPSGRMLARAVMERDAIRHGYRLIGPDDVSNAADLKAFADPLAADYPSLAAPLHESADVWEKRAVELQVSKLVKAGPNEAAFDVDAPTRHALAEAFPTTRAALIVAENDWARRTVEFFELLAGFATGLDGLQTLLSANALEPRTTRFPEARAALFDHALNAAKEAARRQLAANRAEEAFGVARSFAVEWFEEAQFLKRESDLTAFRDGYGYLAFLASKATPLPEPAPPPREKGRP